MQHQLWNYGLSELWFLTKIDIRMKSISFETYGIGNGIEKI